MHRSKKTSKLRVTSLCEGNSPGTGEFLAQRASNAENVSIWWSHHEEYSYGSAIPVTNNDILPYGFTANLLDKSEFSMLNPLTKRKYVP